MNILTPSWDKLASVYAGEIRKVFVSSPWFSAEGIKKLNAFLPDKKLKTARNVEIWFRMNVDDHILGFTDYKGLYSFVERVDKLSKGKRLRLYSSDNLHAKFYASDRKIFITSANLTKNGFVENIEIGIEKELSGSFRDAFAKFADDQRKRLDEVSIVKLKDFVMQLQSKLVSSYHREISRILITARNNISLLTLEEKSPHSKYSLR